MRLLPVFLLAFLTATRCEYNGYVPYDYCDPKLKLCEIPRSHTMCRYPVPGLSQDCMPNINKPLTHAEKLHVLSLHNKLRSRVATGEEKTPQGVLPSASNMLQMRWDIELETIAERWASRCFNVTVTKIHDDCRNTKRFRVTQNIGTIGSKGITAEKQVIQVFYHWYIKSKSFNPRIINAYADDGNKTSEEFLNLIWADSYALGCANVIFMNNLTDSQDGGRTTPWTFERIVCNYGSGGIIPGKPVYKIGTPCSKCPSGWSCSKEFAGLCVLKEYSKSSTRKTTEGSFSSNVQEIFLTRVMSSTYTNVSRKKSESHSMGANTEKWSFSTVGNGTQKHSIKLRIGIYYNGMCHCPDISRYGFERSDRQSPNLTMKLEKLRSLITRSIGNLIPHHDPGKVAFELKNGERCYCKISESRASDQHRPSTLFPYLTLFYVMKLLIYYLQ